MRPLWPKHKYFGWECGWRSPSLLLLPSALQPGLGTSMWDLLGKGERGIGVGGITPEYLESKAQPSWKSGRIGGNQTTIKSWQQDQRKKQLYFNSLFYLLY